MMFCFFYRAKLSARLDDGLDLEPALQRHLHKCAACRRFYDQELSLTRILAHNAGAERVAPSPFLQARIMTALERSRGPSRARLCLRPFFWAAGLASSLALLFFATHRPLSLTPVIATPVVSTAASELAALGKSLPDEQKLVRWSVTLEDPLDREMRCLFHDTRNAARALVLNFVPDSLASSLAGEKATD